MVNETSSIAMPPFTSPLVPGFFVYGDSTVDVGNNNYLQTIARANLAPYGRDFDTHLPTGRFSNGRLSVDYLALFLGLPFVPPLLSRNFTSQMQGVNFASAGAGILNPSGSDLGQHIPMAEQVQHIVEIQQRLASKIGEDAANAVISNSIHYISIGSNDFIHYYLRNVSDVQNKMTNFEFNQLLISSLVGHIEDMYARGIRKVVTIGLGPLGCVPFYLYTFNQTGAGCVDSINFMIAEFNNALRVTAQSLAMKHRNLRIIYCDVFQSLMPIVRTPLQYGFVTSRSACCGAGRFGGWMMCMFPQMACSNASSYLWWDEFHPTDKANFLLARDIWSGNVCEPGGLQDLAKAS
ncbi:GDSL esterase/lipase 7 [Selaginella moellendorffii]|nr:GDSL esterase/lipase 7 [Selaginella moellendorffii]|eukprot:XP_002974632.2 GDSL esterase/lipase 7 [Selaginella moellendorffii]